MHIEDAGSVNILCMNKILRNSAFQEWSTLLQGQIPRLANSMIFD
jgi:hypothetical protein